MRYTKRILTISFLLLAFTSMAQSQAKKVVADNIAGIVGDRIILQSDIKNSIAYIARHCQCQAGQTATPSRRETSSSPSRGVARSSAIRRESSSSIGLVKVTRL